jgi:hypothetical protein
MKPLAVDLCCGLGGWSHALLAEGWDVIGYDIERHEYGEDRYPGQLVIQDIRTIDGRRFRGKVSLITASPPCTEYSYMAMPWSRAKQIRTALLGNGDFPKDYKGSRTISQLNELFNACIRIGQEAGCPIVIENVRVAQEWVGRSRWNFGSYHLWGDVPALMPIPNKTVLKQGIAHRSNGETNFHGHSKSEGSKTAGMNWSDRSKKGQDFTRIAGMQAEGVKVPSEIGRRTDPGKGARFTSRDCGGEGSKSSHTFTNPKGLQRILPDVLATGSKSSSRKRASAEIAKIPFVLAQWIARTFKPKAS